MTIAASELTHETRWPANAGVGVMAAAFAWWFLFDAQWVGPLRMLALKVTCLLAGLDACSYCQSRLEAFLAAGPSYHPAASRIGTAAFLAGPVYGMPPPATPVPKGSVRRDSEKDGALRD